MKNHLFIAAFLSGASLLQCPLSTFAQPAATTLAATGVGPTNATLGGMVNPNSAAAAAYFQFGLTTNYDNLGGFTALPATNTALSLPALVVNASHGTAGANWTQTSATSTNDWWSIASSADGTRLAAVVGGNSGGFGGIYTSTNAGATWTQTSAPGQDWFSIASSADGMRLAAAAFTYIYTSTNGGVTWTQTAAPRLQWEAIASSADGLYLAAAVDGGGIYTSTNGGFAWTPSGAPANAWASIASSADGMRLAAGIFNGGIYTSTNGGVSWGVSGAVPGQVYSSIASSADGMRLATTDQQGFIWTSIDRGATWTRQNGAPNALWWFITSSADGTKLAAVPYSGGIYTSANGGVTWTSGNAPGASWRSIALSADGSQLAAVAYGGGIYTSTGTSSPFTPATTYHYRAVGLNTTGTSLGSDMTFTTATVAPTASGLPASGITASNATLSATLTTGGLNTSAYFQYGPTTNYGSYSATNNLAATNITLSVTNPVSGLSPLTLYHFQLVAANSLGTNASADLAFTTLPLPPAVTNLPASGVNTTNTTLNGSVNPNGAVAFAYFQYGITTNYGSYSVTNTLAATNIAVSVSNLISGLAPGTTYHYLLVAGNSGGIGLGTDLAVTTSAGPPTATTLGASPITSTNATLNGSLFTGGLDTSAYFQYGLTTNYGGYAATNMLAATNVTLSVSNSVSGLTPGTTYHFQLVAGNSAGTNSGADLAFTSGPAAPTAATLPATSITATNATLNGSVNPNGAAAAAYFQFGLTTNYDNEVSFTGLPATNTALNVPGYVVASLRHAAGTNWTQTSAPSNSWYCIASSFDGRQLAVGVPGSGGIYISTNSGGTWTQSSAPAGNWVSIASSADGTRLVAAAAGGGIYVSTNSGGAWTQSSAPVDNYTSLASSADGNQLVAAVFIQSVQSGASGHVYISTDGGVTWTATSAILRQWEAIASSSDGTHLVVAAYQGPIYKSINSGVTWTLTSAPIINWRAIASSADGSRLAAAVLGGGIYVSTNSGGTWTLSSAPTKSWQSIVCSADGKRLTAGGGSSAIYTSTDGGVTWTPNSGPATNAASVAASADGTFLAAVVYGGGIYTSSGTTSPLTPGTTFHYRIAAVNKVGTGTGNDMTFTTTAAAPTATTLTGTGVALTNATLNATVNPNGAATFAYFQYGSSTNYGSYSATNSLAATNAAQSLSNPINSLIPGATYHFQVVALNSVGTNTGADMLFTTLVQGVNFSMNAAAKLPGGAFQFGFTNLSGAGFTVLGTTNLSLPLSNWTVLGAPVESPPGQYQFTDTQATNVPVRFYRVSSP
jgi:hypothetical protein